MGNIDELEDLPQEIKDQVTEAQETPEEGEPQEAAQPERVKVPSRRQQKEQERDAIAQAAQTRADEAAKLAETIRGETAERFARLEGLLQGALQPRYEQQPQHRQEPPEDTAGKAAQLRREATKTLAAGDIDEYHMKMQQADKLERQADIREALARLPQPQQQAPQLPDWVRAVEMHFPDVLQNPAGRQVVTTFAMLDPDPIMNDSKLRRAFERARKEFGGGQQAPVTQQAATPDANLERRRQQLAGSSVNGAARGNGGGKGERHVNIPKNIDYKTVARKAGMPVADYIKMYAESFPEDVSRD